MGELLGHPAHKLVEQNRESGDGDGTAHGFRTSFRNSAAAERVARQVAEMALAHAAKGVEGPTSVATCWNDVGASCIGGPTTFGTNDARRRPTR